MIDDRIFRPLGGDDVLLWSEPGGPIMMKAVAGIDPIELPESQAEAVASALMDLARALRREFGGNTIE